MKEQSSPKTSFVFFRPFSKLLCSEAELYEGFSSYLRVLLLSMPFLITVLAFVSFLPPCGAPGMATAINVIANVVNIGMDVVYIKLFKMGPEGAAWATVTGYGVGALVLLIAVLSKKIKIRFRFPKLSDMKLLKEIIPMGAPFSVTQVGYAIKFAVCGRIAQAFGSTAGMEAFSLCVQALSITSIFLAAVMEASQPIMALLYGQRDYKGEGLVLRNTLILELVFSVACSLLFFIFAKQAAAIYNITEPGALTLAVRGLRIFAFSVISRGVFVTIQKQAQIIGQKIYPLFISLFDGIIGIIPLCFLLTSLLGIDGLFWAYELTGVLTLVICAVWNIVLVRRSNGRLKGLFLNVSETESDVVMDATVTNSAEDISSISSTLQKRCLVLGMDEKKAFRTALLVEEMGIYLKEQLKGRGYMDILLRSFDDRIEIDFRTIGAEADPNADGGGEPDANKDILRSMASEIRYDFVMGMNCTEIVINK